ncbi:MAG: PmoA family protein, partial [Bacteroidetes bacterium]|nr:PmoA family protein [Bacteroidota bacterium]
SIPVQLENIDKGTKSAVVMILPDGEPGLRKFKLIENQLPHKSVMQASTDSNNGQVIFDEEGKKVLQYNYQTVYEKDVIRPESKKDEELQFSNMSGVYYEEYLKAHPELKNNKTTTSSIYSVPRSDYIHPLYGLDGEMLTRDWPDGGHPHHRGIFWAWPEVEYGTQRADIYALQRIFSRPTGNIEYTSGPVFAEIDAENLWMWEDKEAIVSEHAIIRVYHSSSNIRIIDLTIKLLALKDSVTIATRFTNSYGGLNVRMQTPEEQNISYFTDKTDSKPLRAWSDFSGIFEGNKTASGLMVLQHQNNPEYPGEWRKYPDLAWVQPTFPTPDTRYLLSKEVPLILRYRLIIHAGGKPTKVISEQSWDAYHAMKTPQNNIPKTEK